jgi:hypothetical protein
MDEIKWDREAFAQQQQRKAAGPGLGTSLGGLILLFITIGVVGGGGYWFLKTRGMAPSLPEINLPAIGGMGGEPSTNERLLAMDLRLAEIEKRLNITPPSSTAKSSTAASGSTRGNQSSARRQPTPSSATPAAPPAAASATTPAPAPVLFPTPAAQAQAAAQHEAWEATTDRLGMAVGELGEQRREIARTQEDLIQLRQQLERTSVPFELWKNGGRYRVGPISLTLQKTDRKNQRYDLTLYFDDRTVQMKDRVLGERVTFYTQSSEEPLELVVSEISADRISGKLAVPGASEDTLSR